MVYLIRLDPVTISTLMATPDHHDQPAVTIRYVILSSTKAATLAPEDLTRGSCQNCRGKAEEMGGALKGTRAPGSSSPDDAGTEERPVERGVEGDYRGGERAAGVGLIGGVGIADRGP